MSEDARHAKLRHLGNIVPANHLPLVSQDRIEPGVIWTIANGVVYAGRNSGEVLAWDENCNGTCNEIWSRLLDDPIVNSSPTVVNGHVYIGGSNHGYSGRLYVFGLPE